MKIIYLRSNPVSPDPRVEKEINSLLKFGHEVKIIAWDRSASHLSFDRLNLDSGVSSIERFKLKADFGSGLKNLPKLCLFQFFMLARLIKYRKNIDVIHAADFDTILPAIFMRFFFHKKVIYDVYDFYVDAFSVPNILKRIVRKLDLIIMAYVDAVIITNEARVEQITGSKPKALVVIHNSPAVISLPSFESALLNRPFSLAYVGILQPYRLLEEALRIFSRNPQWELHIAGFGALEGIVKSYSDKYKNIIFYGKVEYNKAMHINAQANMLFSTYDPTVPNHKYSSPNKLYEAMLLSKPIVVCNKTGIDQMIVKEKIGFAIDYSENDFERCLQNASANLTKLNDMGKRANLLYNNHYSWSIMEERLGQLYSDLR